MLANRKYTFECPECKKLFTYDEPGEPLCDGPSESEKSHQPKVMIRIKVKSRDREKNVSAKEGAARAKGTLLTSDNILGLGLRVNGRLWTPKDGFNPWTGEEIKDDDPLE